MIESLEIKNFRCFQELHLRGLRRINVIVGDSGSGKTALLEALFICAGMGPEFFFRSQAWRGLGDPTPNRVQLDQESFHDIWKEMFFAFDGSKEIYLAFTDSALQDRHVKIFYSKDEQNRLLRTPTGELLVSVVSPLVFDGGGSAGNEYRGVVALTQEGVLTMPRFTEPYSMAFLTPATVLNADGSAKRFSELSKKKKEGTVVDAVTSIFPEITGLSVQVQGISTAIFADVAALPERIYIGSVSGGMAKYLNILLAIAHQEKGVVMVDEVENGFYCGNLEKIWKGIVRFCQTSDTQLFVTTHSMEFLKAMLPAMEASEDEFLLLRAERERGMSTITPVEGQFFEAALEQNFEVR